MINNEIKELTLDELQEELLSKKNKVDFRINDNLFDDNQLTIVLYNHLDLKELRKLVGNIGESNEYQCHYFALVRKEQLNGIIVNLVFPLIFYNYKQEVSTATVHANMEIVTEEAKKYAELAKVKFQLLRQHLRQIKPILTNSNISYELTFYNNIHKHP